MASKRTSTPEIATSQKAAIQLRPAAIYSFSVLQSRWTRLDVHKKTNSWTRRPAKAGGEWAGSFLLALRDQLSTQGRAARAAKAAAV